MPEHGRTMHCAAAVKVEGRIEPLGVTTLSFTDQSWSVHVPTELKHRMCQIEQVFGQVDLAFSKIPHVCLYIY